MLAALARRSGKSQWPRVCRLQAALSQCRSSTTQARMRRDCSIAVHRTGVVKSRRESRRQSQRQSRRRGWRVMMSGGQKQQKWMCRPAHLQHRGSHAAVPGLPAKTQTTLSLRGCDWRASTRKKRPKQGGRSECRVPASESVWQKHGLSYSVFSFAAGTGAPPTACTRDWTATAQASAVPVHATTHASGLAPSDRSAARAARRA